MRRTTLAALLVATVSCGATQNPAAPTPSPSTDPMAGIPLLVYHNIPATDGRFGHAVRWVCATQPRPYFAPDGSVLQWEIDHYIQDTPCPDRPID